MSTRRAWQRWASVAVAALALTAASGCASSTKPQSVTTVTKTVAAQPTSSDSATSVATAAHPVAGAAQLRAKWASFSHKLSQPVAVSILPVGSTTAAPVNLGSLPTMVAWSTIKVPLAIAAERHNGGALSATAAAITQSDNESAEALWDSLGTPAQASAAVMKVLAQGGSTAQVPSVRLRAGYTIFGQTQWPLPDAARFASHLPCLSDSQRVLGFMRDVAGNQQWGAQIMAAPTATAVKGGWGPGPTSGYVVRQLAVLTLKGGDQVAVAMGTLAAGSSLGSGTAALDQVGRWLNVNIASLPHGRCAG